MVSGMGEDSGAFRCLVRRRFFLGLSRWRGLGLAEILAAGGFDCVVAGNRSFFEGVGLTGDIDLTGDNDLTGDIGLAGDIGLIGDIGLMGDIDFKGLDGVGGLR